MIKYQAKMKSLILFLALLFFSLYSLAGELHLQLDKNSGYLGKYLTGVHFVYSDEKDAIYRDDSFAKWARKAGIRVARFPGGTVIQYWDWKNPTGIIKSDTWDDVNAKKADPKDWMSMDEYLHFVDVSGVTPLIGVNLLSGVRTNRVEESIKRAVEEVKYVVSKGHKGAFYYLGNEDMKEMGGVEEAAKIFLRHAREIKGVDPTARLLWNDNVVDEARMRKFLAIAGKYADGVEFHSKWPYGDGEIDQNVSVEDWQKQYPFNIQKRGVISSRAVALRSYARKIGYPNLIFANNEYGLAQFKKDRFVGFNRYNYGLVAIEFLQDLFIGQFDMSSFWSNVPSINSGGTDRDKKRLIDTESGNRLNPVHYGFELLSSAQGKKLVKIKNGSPSGYGFAALSDQTLEVFLMNKSNVNNTLKIHVGGKKNISPTGTMVSLVDTPDHWGTLKEQSIQKQGKFLEVTLPPLSYSKIVLPLLAGRPH